MYGEDGNFAAKKKAIEEFDAALPILLRKKPDVLAITGDHSTPCAMKGHSWHPQPVLLHSAFSGSDKLERFTETGANTRLAGHLRGQVPDPPDAGERQDVRQVRRLSYSAGILWRAGPDRLATHIAAMAGWWRCGLDNRGELRQIDLCFGCKTLMLPPSPG